MVHIYTPATSPVPLRADTDLPSEPFLVEMIE
jgi:hypothetical protein